MVIFLVPKFSHSGGGLLGIGAFACLAWFVSYSALHMSLFLYSKKLG